MVFFCNPLGVALSTIGLQRSTIGLQKGTVGLQKTPLGCRKTATDCMSAWMCFVHKTEPIRNPLEPKPFRDPFEAL